MKNHNKNILDPVLKEAGYIMIWVKKAGATNELERKIVKVVTGIPEYYKGKVICNTT